MERSPDRYFSPDHAQRKIARDLYKLVADLPLICPHGHVEPRLFADPDMTFGSPTELLLIPDHYIFRMLYSQGVSLEKLGIPQRDDNTTESDHRQAWQCFADHYYLFRGTPTGSWLRDEFAHVFGIHDKLNTHNAQSIYDQIDAKLKSVEFRPRALFDQFNIEVLCTTDAATDTLAHHQAIQASGWHGRILPTFRPDTLINLHAATWPDQIAALSAVSGIEVIDYPSFIVALEQRRAFFKQMGARATDHGVLTAYTAVLPPHELSALWQRARASNATAEDTQRFTGHMLMEMARMSVEDGLVMQLHVGSYRNHNQAVFDRFGSNMGADIPTRSEFTRDLRPLLNTYGNHPNLTLILFNLDETAYARELAPLAGHYPAVKLGPPWWFHDSRNGMRRYFDQVMETAGLYNTVGFNDDTRAFPSLLARHDLWRRASADWVAGLVVGSVVDEADGAEMVHDLAYNLAKQAYHL